MQVLGWGVRNMRKFQLAPVTSPSIDFEIGGHVLETKVIKNTKKNPNFDEPLLFLDIVCSCITSCANLKPNHIVTSRPVV